MVNLEFVTLFCKAVVIGAGTCVGFALFATIAFVLFVGVAPTEYQCAFVRLAGLGPTLDEIAKRQHAQTGQRERIKKIQLYRLNSTMKDT